MFIVSVMLKYGFWSTRSIWSIVNFHVKNNDLQINLKEFRLLFSQSYSILFFITVSLFDKIFLPTLTLDTSNSLTLVLRLLWQIYFRWTASEDFGITVHFKIGFLSPIPWPLSCPFIFIKFYLKVCLRSPHLWWSQYWLNYLHNLW